MIGLIHVTKWRCYAIPGLLVLVNNAFCSTSASAGTRRDDVADSAYTDLAAQPDFQSVGKVTSTGLGLGSGTLIDSRWVLTAGHMLSFPNPSGVTFNINGVDYTAAEWIPHPLWNSDIGVNGFDIGLIRLNASVPGVTPASRYTGFEEFGTTATIVGYGSTGTGLTGWQSNTYGTKRAGNNVIDVSGVSVLAHENYLVADFDRPNVPSESSFGSSTPLGLEYSSAPGDSGGGVFINDDGVQRLAGVVSFGQHGPTNVPDGNANADYGDLLGFTRVSAFDSWIDDQMSTRYWSNAAGGAFGVSTNWDEGLTTDSGNVAVFHLPGTYTVSLSGDVDNKRVRVLKGDVTLDLAGHTYTLSNTALDRSIVVGQRSGEAHLKLSGSGTVNAVDVSIGEIAGNGGLIELSANGTSLNVSGAIGVGGSPTVSGSSGTLIVNTGTFVHVNDTLKMWTFSGLQFNGGTITTRNFEFAGGTIDGTGGGTLNIEGNGRWTAGRMIGTGTLISANIQQTGSLTYDNPSTESFFGTLNNDGALRVQQGTLSIGRYINQTDGRVEVNGGTLNFSGNLIHRGSVHVTAGAKVHFVQGTHSFDDVAFTNSGTIQFSNFATEFNNAVVPGNVIFSSGTVTFGSASELTGAVTLDGSTLDGIGRVTASNVTWIRGVLASSGGLFIPSGGTLLMTPTTISNGQMNGGAILEVAGTAVLDTSNGALSTNSNNAPIVQINSSGSFDIQGIRGFVDSGGSSVGIINNAGTFKRTTSTGLVSVNGAWTLNNTGNVEVQSGTLRFTGPVTQLSGSTLTGGTWTVVNGSTLTLSAGANITVLGAGASIRLSGATAAFAKVNALTTNNGTFQIDSGKNFTVTSTFTNNSTLNVGNGSTFTANDISHSAGAGAINVQSGGNLLANHLRANASTIDGIVTVRANGGAVGTSKVESLSIGSGGKLNLRNNDLVVGTGDMLEIRALIKAGISGVTNTAAISGITSDMMTKNVHGFGYAAGNDSHISSLLSDTHTLSGRSYDADSVLVKFTYRGDADLDGDSDLGDLGFWADSFTGDLGSPATPTTFWTQGDWDYDGDTDLDDLGFWSSTFTGDLGGGGLSVYAPNAPAGAIAALSQMGITAVPEAGSVSLLGIGMLALAMRRRRLVAR